MLPLILGAALVAAVWASKSSGKHVVRAEVSAPAQTVAQTNVPADGTYEDPNVEMDQDPTGQNSSQVASTTTTETGAETTTVEQPSQPSSTSTAPPQAPQMASAPEPQTTDTTTIATAPIVVQSLQAGLTAKAGSMVTKADTSEYYSSQLNNGTVVL